MPLTLSQLPTGVGQSTGVLFFINGHGYNGTATRMNATDSWIITNPVPSFLSFGPPLDPPILYVTSSLLDSLAILLTL